MPLLNYTTKIAADKTISEIQKMLARSGARSIAVQYDADAIATGLVFAIETPLGERSFALPVGVGRVLKVLETDHVEPRYRTDEQAEKVAWRIIKDWLEAQLALIDTDIVSLDQVMLPYMQSDSGRTVYELYIDRQLALSSGVNA